MSIVWSTRYGKLTCAPDLEYGGLNLDQARRLKKLEQENARLKRTVADLALDKQILKEAAEGNF